MKRDIVTARIDGMLCRAEKAGMDAGMEAGMEAGIVAGKLETARNMVKKGYPIGEILDVTGLSEKDILNDKLSFFNSS